MLALVLVLVLVLVAMLTQMRAASANKLLKLSAKLIKSKKTV